MIDMRILVYGLSPNLGGVEAFLMNYCVAIRQIRSDYQFDFVVLEEIPQYAKFLTEYGFRFIVLPSPMRRPIRYKRALISAIRSGRYDCAWGNYCTLTDVSFLACCAKCVPIRVAHSHNSQNMGRLYNRVLHAVNKLSISKMATHFFACSSEAGQFMFGVKACRSKNYSIIRNSIDVRRFAYDRERRSRFRSGKPWEGHPLVITVGRIHQQKNPRQIIDVFEGIKQEEKTAKLLYLGVGPMMGEIKEYVHKKGLGEAVFFLGNVANTEEYLWAADLFLFPSYFEGFSVALLEAQATGLPCLVSDGVIMESLLVPWVKQIPLHAKIDVWVKAALDLICERPNRLEGETYVRDAGYDIVENAIQLTQLLDEAVKGQ